MLPDLTPEEEQEIASLTDRVRIYELYRKKAFGFIQQWQVHPLLPAHFWAQSPPTFFAVEPVYPAITAADLHDTFQTVVKKIPKPVQPRAHLTVRGKTLQEWLAVFSQRLSKVRNIVFQEAVKGASRQDTAVSFLALLEMARNKEIEITQNSDTQLVISRRV